MPISVEIKVNDKTIDVLHIARLRGSTTPGSMNEYSIMRSSQIAGYTMWPEPAYEEDWLEGVRFEHEYGTGISNCVQAGMAALEAAGNKF